MNMTISRNVLRVVKNFAFIDAPSIVQYAVNVYAKNALKQAVITTLAYVDLSATPADQIL